MPSITAINGASTLYLLEASFPQAERPNGGIDRASTPAGDTAEFSPEALKKARQQDPAPKAGSIDPASNMSDEEKKKVNTLKQRDQEVRAHEQAHVMAGGSLVRGGASYQFQTGPDGNRYAINGEVSIDTSPVKDDPRATVRKAQQVQKAALAPAQPSGQDQAVAASALSMQMKAIQELAALAATGKTSTVNKRA